MKSLLPYKDAFGILKGKYYTKFQNRASLSWVWFDFAVLWGMYVQGAFFISVVALGLSVFG